MDDKEVDMCLLEGHEERLKSIDVDLQEIKCGMLLIDDYKNFAGRAAGLEEASFQVRVAIKCLLKDVKVESAASKNMGLSGVQLPKISVPTFDNKVLNWKSFWEQFDATINSKTGLNDMEKLMYMYLRMAQQDL